MWMPGGSGSPHLTNPGRARTIQEHRVETVCRNERTRSLAARLDAEPFSVCSPPRWDSTGIRAGRFVSDACEDRVDSVPRVADGPKAQGLKSGWRGLIRPAFACVLAALNSGLSKHREPSPRVTAGYPREDEPMSDETRDEEQDANDAFYREHGEPPPGEYLAVCPACDGKGFVGGNPYPCATCAGDGNVVRP
jgi:hypothetical protein